MKVRFCHTNTVAAPSTAPSTRSLAFDAPPEEDEDEEEDKDDIVGRSLLICDLYQISIHRSSTYFMN